MLFKIWCNVKLGAVVMIYHYYIRNEIVPSKATLNLDLSCYKICIRAVFLG